MTVRMINELVGYSMCRQLQLLLLQGACSWWVHSTCWLVNNTTLAGA